MPVVINGTTGISGVNGSNTTPAIQGTDTNTGLVFPAADTIAFVEGGTEVMRIDANGAVGVGTNNPSLYASPGQVVDYNSGTAAFWAVGGNVSSYLFSSNAGQVSAVGTTSNHPFTFYTNGTERMRIDSSGDLTLTSNNLFLGTRSIATNGYTRLPNGLLLQWGTSGSIAQDSSGSVTFPIAFTTLYCINITGRQAINTTSGGLDTISTQSTTGFTIAHGGDGTSTFYWMALGI